MNGEGRLLFPLFRHSKGQMGRGRSDRPVTWARDGGWRGGKGKDGMDGMLRFIRMLFLGLRELESFLVSEVLKGLSGFVLIFWLLLIGGALLSVTTGNVPPFFTSAFFMLMLIIYLIGLLNFKFFGLYDLKGMFIRFSFIAYLICLFWMSALLLIFLMGSKFALLLAGVNVAGPSTREGIATFFYVVMCIESIAWFAFHIVSNRTSLQDIKVKVAQYSAIAATVLIGAELSDGVGSLKLPLSLIALSYLWVTYLIELEGREREKQGMNRHRVAMDERCEKIRFDKRMEDIDRQEKKRVPRE